MEREGGFWRFSRAKNPFSLPFQTPATQAKFHVRCGYTRFPLRRIAWGCSGFWSLSCLRLHPDKLLKVKSKLEPGFAVNVPVNIEDWHKLYKAFDDYYLFDKTLAIAVKASDILWLRIRGRRHHPRLKKKQKIVARKDNYRLYGPTKLVPTTSWGKNSLPLMYCFWIY